MAAMSSSLCAGACAEWVWEFTTLRTNNCLVFMCGVTSLCGSCDRHYIGLNICKIRQGMPTCCANFIRSYT